MSTVGYTPQRSFEHGLLRVQGHLYLGVPFGLPEPLP